MTKSILLTLEMFLNISFFLILLLISTSGLVYMFTIFTNNPLLFENQTILSIYLIGIIGWIFLFSILLSYILSVFWDMYKKNKNDEGLL